MRKREKIPSEVLEAQRRFREIRSLKAAGDYEAAHGAEDYFRLWVIKRVIDGSQYAVMLAKVAVRASKMEFPRHCG